MKTNVRIATDTVKQLRQFSRLNNSSVVNVKEVDEWVTSADIIHKEEIDLENLKHDFESATGTIMLIPEHANE